MKRKRDNEEGDSNGEHAFPRVLGCMRRSHIKESDITEAKVYFTSRITLTMNLQANVDPRFGGMHACIAYRCENELFQFNGISSVMRKLHGIR